MQQLDKKLLHFVNIKLSLNLPKTVATMMSNSASTINAITSMPRRLAAFDFDYTVVAQNTDTVVRDLMPRSCIPPEVDALIDSAGWTQYMSEIFGLLQQQNYREDQIRATIRGIPEVPGFVKCLKTLRQLNCDLIIISDSNSVFIEEWLQSHGLVGCIDAVFTNPAEFLANGRLGIKPYHHQTECRLSAPNLCKGKVLEHFVLERNLRCGLKYEQVIYVGDGNNDICPVLRLKPGDVGCARSGFGMAKNLAKNRHKLSVKAQLLHWKDGFDLLAQLQAIFAPTGIN